MAWKIHAWSPATGSGSIASDHAGPLPFDVNANVRQVADFVVGEPVDPWFEGEPPNLSVLRIQPQKRRQPPDTDWPAFAAANRFGEAIVQPVNADVLEFWVGDCCQRCTPDAVRVRFENVYNIRRPQAGEELDLDDPYFRLAAAEEILQAHIDVPDGYCAFCIATSSYQCERANLYIVARTALVVST